ncbi:MAG: universal stress protein [Acidobacteriota bacterium]|nr:universal stress protein [Acidobacteriota bacterium]MDE3190347.1 universal stress protein [Acidobacteriota bacterium]
MKSIMLATDGSPSAEQATQDAIELARALHLPLTVVSVAHAEFPLLGYYGYAYADVVAELRTMQREHVERVLASVRERAAAAGVAGETVALEGMPGEEICRAARERRVRMIVVGAHGWGRMGRLIHGSVSDYVLHHAEMPVLLVAGEPATEAHPIAA